MASKSQRYRGPALPEAVQGGGAFSGVQLENYCTPSCPPTGHQPRPLATLAWGFEPVPG